MLLLYYTLWDGRRLFPSSTIIKPCWNFEKQEPDYQCIWTEIQYRGLWNVKPFYPVFALVELESLQGIKIWWITIPAYVYTTQIHIYHLQINAQSELKWAELNRIWSEHYVELKTALDIANCPICLCGHVVLYFDRYRNPLSNNTHSTGTFFRQVSVVTSGSVGG